MSVPYSGRRRKITAPAAAFELMDLIAASQNLPWSRWALRVLARSLWSDLWVVVEPMRPGRVAEPPASLAEIERALLGDDPELLARLIKLVNKLPKK